MLGRLLRYGFLAILLLGAIVAAAFLPRALGRIDDPSLEPRFDADQAPPAPERSAVPPVETRRALFGDLHVHTAYSPDAYIFGVRALPDEAYRFAKGGTIEHGAGYAIRLGRPLDFLAVTDHAEYLAIPRRPTSTYRPSAGRSPRRSARATVSS